jgi:hypothetical protein
MAKEIKNTFLKSKMNKDLDDRILPNGEYRDARNISVGRSEDNDVGALENVIGNDLIRGTDIGNGLTIIGVHANNATDQVFVFLTNYTDPNPFQPTDAPSASLHYIYVYNNSTGDYTKLVQGNFLNFSTTNRIIGINLLENLLFWTDNRNQPRKINVTLADTSGNSRVQEYYTQEHQISVAKYNPYQAIELYTSVVVQSSGTSTQGYINLAGDQEAEIIPFIGGTVVSAENAISGNEFHRITGVSLNIASGDTRVVIEPPFSSTPTSGTYFTFIKSTMTNKNEDNQWAGDPDYLEDRFVRFSYRFKYDDNEYSLMAPFTQIAYIPKQKGYFINGDEEAAYQSTIVSFMENSVQNIGLVIPLPTNSNRLVRDYKISEIELLFRESDSVAVKVLESLAVGEVSAASGTSNYFTYDYQSRKPYKTLPEAQTVRVYDKVPVRAFSQESSGNRIIYGNYRDQHTPPDSLDYNCTILPKSDSGSYSSWIEYPNHSVKKNRNYQIGFVLADKFGRQSPVLLSSVDAGVTQTGEFFSGSTIYNPYYSEAPTAPSVLDSFGDSIRVLVNSQISSIKNSSTGTPGLYAIEQQEGTIGTGQGFATLGSPVIVSDSTYTFSLSSTAYPNNDNIPRQNDYLRGAYEDFVKVTNITGPSGGGQVYTVTTSGRVNDVYLRADNLPANTPDIKFAYTINDLGWYSYKIVVKQTEQDYYNVYLPGILNGYPFPQTTDAGFGVTNGAFPTNETNNTAFTTLFNDNINKIPRDLQEVGPDQKQYSSSVLLYGRVTNITEGSLPDGTPYNKQYYPRIFSQGKNAIAHTSTAIANAAEVNMSFRDILGVTPFYQIDTNPLIARISTTEKGIGATYGSNPVQSSDFYMQPYLAVYETEPTESLLEIYWETTTAGLIVDLNTAIASGSGGASSFENVNWDFKEGFLPSTSGAPVYVTDEFYPLNEEGDPYLIDIEGELVSVIDGNGDSAEGLFSLQPGVNANTFRLRFDGPSQVFREGSIESNVYTFEINITPDGEPSAILTLGGIEEGEGAMQNVAPAFNFATIVQKNPLDRTLIPAVPNTAATPWLATLPANGTSATNNSKKSQLVYTIARQDGNPLPSNWSMSPSTGKLTQAIPGDVIEGVEFLGNPAVVYPCTITITDANASGANGFYGSLTAQRDVDISLGYPAVNDGVISDTCVLNAYGTNGTDGTPGNAIKSDTQNDKVSHIYYIGGDDFDTNLNTIWDDNGLSNFDRFTNSTRLNNGSVNNAHKTGTVAFTFNVQQGNGTVPRGVSSFKIEKVVFYYRFEGGNGIWQELDRSLDYNATDKKATSGDFPGEDGLVVSNTDNEDTIKWLQNVRAYDYAAFAANSGGAGVEYAVLIKDLELKSGQGGNTGNTVYGWVTADDLHYPICANRQGINVSATSYKYFRSPGSGSYGAATVGLDEVFAETPYGEYVNLFFTSAAMTEPYIPAVGLNNVNFQLDQTGYETLYQWDDLASFSDITLRWVASFSTETGIKEASPYNSSKATTTYVAASSNPGNGLRILNGTTRVKNNQ